MNKDRKVPLPGISPKAAVPSRQRQAPVAGIAQSKMAAKGQPKQRAAAPPVYHPQPVPKILQTKKAASQRSQLENPVHKATPPPAYRPQPIPKVLQARNSNPAENRPKIVQCKTSKLQEKSRKARNGSPQAGKNLLQLKPAALGSNQVIQRLLITYPDLPNSTEARGIETDSLDLAGLKSELGRLTGIYSALPDSEMLNLPKEAFQRALLRLEGVINVRSEAKEVDALRASCDPAFARKHVVYNAPTPPEALKRAWGLCARRDGEVFQNTVLFLNTQQLAEFQRAAMQVFKTNGKVDDNYPIPYDIPLLAHTSEEYSDRISVWAKCRITALVKKDGPHHARITHLDSVHGGTRLSTHRFGRETGTGRRFLIDIKYGDMVARIYLD